MRMSELMRVVVRGVCLSVLVSFGGFAAVSARESAPGEPSVVEALAGLRCYGDNGDAIQSPGAQAGAYVYAGTSTPYEAPESGASVEVIPDSLDVVFVNHVGRHGARYFSSDKFTRKLSGYLRECGELTPVGERVKRLCSVSDSVMSGRWGALDALGREEQSGIGRRMAERYGALLERRDSVEGIASYVPRCVMSMDELTHGAIWVDRSLEVATGSGKRYTPLMRFFDVDKDYLCYKDSDEWRDVYKSFADSVCPTAVVLRLSAGGARLIERLCDEAIASGVPASGGALEEALSERLRGEWSEDWVKTAGITKADAIALAGDLYSVVSGCAAVSYGSDPEIAYSLCDWRMFFTSREYERLWECGNLKHYLTYSANGLSNSASRMAAPLLRNLVETLEEAAKDDYSGPAIRVRLGHAETMMPLLSLMDLPGCSYVTTDWGSVADRWMDWNVASMAANLQLVLCRSKASGALYLVTLRNENRVGDPERFSAAISRMKRQAGM